VDGTGCREPLRLWSVAYNHCATVSKRGGGGEGERKEVNGDSKWQGSSKGAK
jgi:hypothetical protein